MDLGLTGRVAIIGGGSKGLGRACADSLAQEGANLAICSRNAEELEQAASEIRAATGAEVLAVPADLSRLEDIQRLVQSAVHHYGRLDIAVANSGGPPAGATDTSEETWSQSIDMALSFFIRMGREATWSQSIDMALSFFIRMGREATPHMREQKWGRIVNILASTVYQPIDNLVTSGVTRMGAVAYAKSLADEVGRDNVLVNNVAPGFLMTERMRHIFETRSSETGQPLDSVLEAGASRIPVGRFGRPEELGDFVAYLCSDKNTYVTGTTILVDGGVVRSVM